MDLELGGVDEDVPEIPDEAAGVEDRTRGGKHGGGSGCTGDRGVFCCEVSSGAVDVSPTACADGEAVWSFLGVTVSLMLVELLFMAGDPVSCSLFLALCAAALALSRFC